MLHWIRRKLQGTQLKNDVAIIHRYFWPQNYPYATMLRYIAEGFVDKGITLAIYSCHEPDSEQKKERQFWAKSKGIYTKSLGIKSERNFKIWQKAISAIFFSCWVFYVALTCRSRVIWVATTPPLLMVSVLRLARIFREFKIVYHCQDIHPEALALNGNVINSILLQALKFVDSSNIRASDLVITLSEDMRDTINSRKLKPKNLKIINNFILEDKKILEYQRHNNSKLLFAGSLGRFQNLDFLTDVSISLARDVGIETIFMGDGPLRSEMEKKVIDAGLTEKIEFTGHKPISEAIDAMHSSRFGLISLTKGVDCVAYPSKSIMYLAAGLPCIAFVSPKSSMGKMLIENRLGIAIKPGDVGEAVKDVIYFLNNDVKKIRPKSEIIKFANSEFSKDVIVSKISHEVDKLLNEV